MAQMSIDLDKEFFNELKKHEDISKIADKMVAEASPAVVKTLKTEIGKHKRTDDLAKSVKATKPKRNKNNESYVVVRPTGKSLSAISDSHKTYRRKTAVRNMEKLASLEFGNSQGQKPTPVIEQATEKAESDVIAKMTEVYEKETGI